MFVFLQLSHFFTFVNKKACPQQISKVDYHYVTSEFSLVTPQSHVKQLYQEYMQICVIFSTGMSEKPTKFNLYCYLYLFHILQYTFPIKNANRISMYNTKTCTQLFLLLTQEVNTIFHLGFTNKNHICLYTYITLYV